MLVVAGSIPASGQVHAVLKEAAGVVRLASAVGENDREVRDDDRPDRREGGQPSAVVDEDHYRDGEARHPDAHHDEVAPLAVGDVLRQRPARLRHQVDLRVPPDVAYPHGSTVPPPGWSSNSISPGAL